MNPLVEALKKFIAHENQRKFQIFEDVEDVTPSNTRPSSPILSASSGLSFSCVQPKFEVDADEGYFSPCSTSTPGKSSSSSPSSIVSSCEGRRLFCEAAQSTAQSTTTTLPSERPLKRKGLSVVDSNVSSPVRKRIRFEEHCVDYESIDKRARVNDELTTTDLKLAALETMHPKRGIRDLICEMKLRIRALESYYRNLRRGLDTNKGNRMSR